MGLDQNFYRVKSNGIGYLRKANQIRKWLVTHEVIEDSDNCETRRVSKENLEELKKDIETVLADNSKASELLPLCDGGYFFGTYSTDDNPYDERYFGQLKETLDIVNDAIENTDWDNGEYITYSDWW